MMKGSIRCFVYGLLGLLPIIGLPFALAALWISGQVRVSRKNSFGTPAKPYRICGVICAAVGAILWGGILVLIIGNVVITPGSDAYQRVEFRDIAD